MTHLLEVPDRLHCQSLHGPSCTYKPRLHCQPPARLRCQSCIHRKHCKRPKKGATAAYIRAITFSMALPTWNCHYGTANSYYHCQLGIPAMALLTHAIIGNLAFATMALAAHSTIANLALPLWHISTMPLPNLSNDANLALALWHWQFTTTVANLAFPLWHIFTFHYVLDIIWHFFRFTASALFSVRLYKP